MKIIGGWAIMRKAEIPHIEKAAKLARVMTLDEIEQVLSGKKHLHGNPTRRKKMPLFEGVQP